MSTTATPGLTPTQDDLDYFTRSKVTDEKLRKRMVMERAVVRSALEELLADPTVVVRLHDGEDWATSETRDVAFVMKELMATDEESIAVRQTAPVGERRTLGHLYLVYGNDGWDVIADLSVQVDALLPKTNALSEALCEACAE